MDLDQALLKFVEDSGHIIRETGAYTKGDTFMRAFDKYVKDTNMEVAYPPEPTADVEDAQDATKTKKRRTDNEPMKQVLRTLGDLGMAEVEDNKFCYLPYPGEQGALQNSVWVYGLDVTWEWEHGKHLATMVKFLQSGKFTFTPQKYIKYNDFQVCLEAYCLEQRVPPFKPTPRLLRDVGTRFNLAVESSGVRPYRGEVAIKAKWLLGVDLSE